MDTCVIAPIRNEQDYRNTERTVRALWGAIPDPIDAIQIRMQELGIDRAEFARVLSTTSGRVSEILNRRRRLSIDMIRRLAGAMGLSERCLLQPYELAPRGSDPAGGASGRRQAALGLRTERNFVGETCFPKQYDILYAK